MSHMISRKTKIPLTSAPGAPPPRQPKASSVTGPALPPPSFYEWRVINYMALAFLLMSFSQKRCKVYQPEYKET